MSEMSQASAPAGGDPLGLPDAVTDGAGVAEAEEQGSGGADASSGVDPQPRSGEGEAPEPSGGDGTPGEEPAVEALSRVTGEDPASGSDPMPDIAGRS